MKTKLYLWCLFALLFGFAFFMQNCQEQEILIPEENSTFTEIDSKPIFNKKSYFKITDDAFVIALNDSYPGTVNSDGWVEKSKAEEIPRLDINGYNIRDLKGIEYFINLEHLACANNLLETIDISKNTKLELFDCQTNSIESLNLSHNTLLKELYCWGNKLESLDVSKCPVIETIHCWNNKLEKINVSRASELKTLWTQINKLENLDLSNCPNLEELDCSENQLDCIQVNQTQLDNIPISWAKDQRAFYSLNCNLTYVPDDNFEQALIEFGYDTGSLDDYVPTAIIKTITHLDVSVKSISNLTGIEDFESLLWLNCKENNLTKLELSNPFLEYLSCWGNSLKILNVSKCKNLKTIYCSNNNLTKLDISKNLSLVTLDCQINVLTELILNNNNSLEYLDCRNNQLQKLDLKISSNLNRLVASENQLISIDINGCINLETLDCSDNLLTNLNVGLNIKLYELHCQINQIEKLNVKNNSELIALVCFENQLTDLNVSSNFNLLELLCFDNLLNCIQVNQNQIDTKIDLWESGLPLNAYSLDCN